MEPNEDQTAADQAAEAPTVATSDVASDPASETDPTQLAADGDGVVDGLEENHVNPVAPDEGQ